MATFEAENTSVAPIEADHFEDHDSTLGDEESSYTASLRTSLLQSVTENGRGYHKYRDGAYILPEDEAEQARLDLQHDMLCKVFGGKLILAPLDDSSLMNVLDLGTGTGIWAIEYADQHPQCQVLGVDLSPIQPGFVPPNCKFEVDDFESDWTYKQKFDLIHGRWMLTSMGNPPHLFKKAYDNMSPGGWFELQDLYMPILADDGTMKGTAWQKWNDIFHAAVQKIGRDASWAANYKEWMEETGFVNVEQRVYKIPVGTWPKNKFLKELGAINYINNIDGLEGYTMRLFTKVYGMSVEDTVALMEEVKKDLANKKIHSYWPVFATFGQKPT